MNDSVTKVANKPKMTKPHFAVGFALPHERDLYSFVQSCVTCLHTYERAYSLQRLQQQTYGMLIFTIHQGASLIHLPYRLVLCNDDNARWGGGREDGGR